MKGPRGTKAGLTPGRGKRSVKESRGKKHSTKGLRPQEEEDPAPSEKEKKRLSRVRK